MEYRIMKKYCLFILPGDYEGKTFLIKGTQKRKRFRYEIVDGRFYIYIGKEKHRDNIKNFLLDK